jgi:ribosomal protein S18 acetylase RimI-like enzyme
MKLSDKGIIIRKTIEEDLPQIYSAGRNQEELANSPFTFSAENLADIFASDSSICYTAARKKKVLGFIACSIKDDESIIRWIMVNKNFRHAGIGKALLTKCIEASNKTGIENFLIDVLENNDSVKFLSGSGFNLKETVLKFKL